MVIFLVSFSYTVQSTLFYCLFRVSFSFFRFFRWVDGDGDVYVHTYIYKNSHLLQRRFFSDSIFSLSLHLCMCCFVHCLTIVNCRQFSDSCQFLYHSAYMVAAVVVVALFTSWLYYYRCWYYRCNRHRLGCCHCFFLVRYAISLIVSRIDVSIYLDDGFSDFGPPIFVSVFCFKIDNVFI